MTKADEQLLAEFTQGLRDREPSMSDKDVKHEGFKLFLRHKVLTDLYFFGAEVMGWKNSKSKDGKRWRLQPDLHYWLANLLEKNEDKMILIPRLHLKSTWLKLAICQAILQNPNVRILLVSETASLCELELSDIKRMLAEPIILELFPDVVPDPGKDYKNWQKSTHNMLITKRDTPDEKEQQEPQVYAIGVGGRLTGMHFDAAYIDDMIGPESVYTETQMKKREEWWAYLQSIIEIDAPITITGTFYHYLDIYNKIIREKQFKNVYIRRAVENGKIIYNRWFKQRDLDKIRRRQGEYIYSCQYMLNPIPDTSKLLPGPYPTYKMPEQGKYVHYIAIDPAGTNREWSDASGFAIGMVDGHDRLWIEEVVGQKLTLDPKKEHSFADFLITKTLQYHPQKVGMEMGVLEAIKYIVEAKVTEWENKTGDTTALAPLHNIIPIPIPHNKSKAQRISLGIGAFLREGKCFIKETCTELMQQMATFTGKDTDHDDLIDAANMLLYLHDRFAQHYFLKRDIRSGTTYFDILQPRDKTLQERYVS